MRPSPDAQGQCDCPAGTCKAAESARSACSQKSSGACDCAPGQCKSGTSALHARSVKLLSFPEVKVLTIAILWAYSWLRGVIDRESLHLEASGTLPALLSPILSHGVAYVVS